MKEVLWRATLSGFLYEAFYQLALAARWATGTEGFSFLAAVAAGVIIALIISLSPGQSRKSADRPAAATLLGLVLAFAFHLLSVKAGIPEKVLFHFDAVVTEIGHTTANENITIDFVTIVYLLSSFIAFICAIGVALALKGRRRQASRPAEAVEENNGKTL